ncbi:hypothetical protein SLE2022_072600 [Rubroshorea leprosula]
MFAMILWNAEMVISTFERNGTYSSSGYQNPFFSNGFSSHRPVSGVDLKKKVRTLRFKLINRIGGGIPREEMEFRPSFHEYLKDMESVKTAQEKKLVLKSKRYKTEDDSRRNYGSRTVLPQRDEEDVKLRKFGEFSDEEKVCEYVERHEVKGNGERARTSKGDKAFLKKGSDNKMEIERAAFKNLEEFNGVLDKPRVSRMEMEERTQKLAKLLNGADIDMPEWMFSKMMRSAKIKFSDHSILRVIQLLGKLGNWRRVVQVMEWLQMGERFKSHRLRHIYTTALNVLGKARRPVEALNLFCAMQQQMSSYPDLVAYRCIAITLGQAGCLKELFDVIDSMRSPPKKKFKHDLLGKWDPRLEPDLVVYNAILNACAKRRQWEGAFWVLQELKKQSQRPSTTTYGLAMEVMYVCGKYNLVHEFFRKIEKSSLPNALAYRVLVNTLWKEGKIDQAVLAVQDMERRGIVGSAALYYDLARCLCSAGRCQEALTEIQKICKVANKPLVVTYTGLIQACVESGNIQDAAYIFNQMQEFCSPNLVTFNIMLKAYLEHGLFDEATKLFHKMSESTTHICNTSDYKHQVIPDTYAFNIMLDACTQEGRWDDFEYVYKRMLHMGYHFNAKRHLQMILNAAKAGKGEPLESTWEHLTRVDRIPPITLIKERFCMKLMNNDCVSALACITTHHLSDSPAFSKSAWLNLFNHNTHRFGQDTIAQLLNEINIIFSKTDSSSPVLQNLLTSCKELLRT